MGSIPRNSIPFHSPSPQPAETQDVARQRGPARNASVTARTVELIDIAKGISEVRVHCHDHGIPHEYVNTMAGYAKAHHVAFVARARNPGSHDFHVLCHPVLPRQSKLATAKRFGPLTGLVPADEVLLSQEARQQVRQLLKGGASSTELTLTKTHIEALIEQGVLHTGRGPVPGTLRLSCVHPETNQNVFFNAVEKKPSGSGNYTIYHDGKPVTILGENRGDRILPYTDPIDVVSVSAGNSKQTAAHVNAMNVALERENTPALQARDAHTVPYGDQADFFPCVVFGPPEMKIDGAALATNADELARLFKAAAMAGCPLAVDPAWPADIRSAVQLHNGLPSPASIPAAHGGALQKQLMARLAHRDPK